MNPTTPHTWRKSTRSGDNQGHCLEVAIWHKTTRDKGAQGNTVSRGDV
ncbi:DUF397 domain-containing protein [Stackebrandtia sp.]|jgi:hypothetical protein